MLKYLGFAVLNFILFIRYVILPLFSCLSGLYTHSYISFHITTYNSTAVVIILFEMIAIFFFLNIFIRKLNNINEVPVERVVYQKRNIFYVVSILLGVLSYFLIPAIKQRVNFIIVSDLEIQNLDTLSSFAFLFSLNSMKLLFILILTKSLKPNQEKNWRYKLFVFIIAFISIGVVASGNRLTILAQGVATIALLNFTHQISRKGMGLLGILILLIIFSLTSYRLFDSKSLGTVVDAKSYFDLTTANNYLQSYFGGADLIALSVGLKSDLPLLGNLGVFFNEILSSIIFVRQLIPLSPESSIIAFNRLFGYMEVNSMILPTLGQSYIYFGIFGAPLLSIFFCWLLYRTQKFLLTAKDLGEKYSFYLLTLWLAFFPVQNINIISATIFNVFLPLYILVKINRMFKFIM